MEGIANTRGPMTTPNVKQRKEHDKRFELLASIERLDSRVQKRFASSETALVTNGPLVRFFQLLLNQKGLFEI